MSQPAAVARNRFTQGQLPAYTPWLVLAGAAILAAAAMAVIGFNPIGWAVLTALVYVLGITLASYLVEGRRKATNAFFSALIVVAFLIALTPLISVIFTVLSTGIKGLLAPGFFASDMFGITGLVDQKTTTDGLDVFGGIQHALVGTVLITLTATIISVPIGLLTSIYLVEYARGGWLAKVITFFVDVMTGIPSIVAGLFAAGVVALVVGPANVKMGFTAAIALSVLMVPVVVRSTEEMLRVVPHELREASYALGVRKWRTIMKVVLPTAMSGIASGVTLAIARVIGETAPILVTAGAAVSTNWNMFYDWMMSLPVFIYRQLMNPTSPTATDPSTQRAWAAALLLILVVMALNLTARLIARAFAPKKSGR